ncbi:MAG TPA: LodA/GoxA family CTQ-dependent oxidase [Myxococcales bacterium]|nr:LodA/GoxA family CTQ-dependent oxidase [Myxococcales bacterium]
MTSEAPPKPSKSPAPKHGGGSAVDPDEIAYCKIHPGLGIARVGNSPDEFFIGPESPGHMPHPAGGFKDGKGRVKRQAARFRIYAYNKAGEPIAELTASDADIQWSVQLANKKSSYDMFLGRYWDLQFPEVKKYADENNGGRPPLRNQEVTDPAQRQSLLEIHPEARSIQGCNQQGDKYQMTGTFGPLKYSVVTPENKESLAGSRSGFMNVPFVDPNERDLTRQFKQTAKKYGWQPGVMQEPVAESASVDVYLGELRTDPHGRLLVLGGRGESRSLIPDNPVGFLNGDFYFGSNDYWHDDTSDGVVSATVTLKSGRPVEVHEKSWVLVAPPKFAPHLEPLTTLWDVSEQVAAQKGERPPLKEVSFLHDVYPLLQRLNEYQWVNQFALQQHGSGMVFDPLSEGPGTANLFPKLHHKDDPSGSNRDLRLHVFKRMRKPLPVLHAEHPELGLKELLESQWANENSGMSKMPQMWGDGGDGLDPVGKSAASPTSETNPGGGVPGGTYVTWATLTPRQYEALRLWAEGHFVDDWPPGASPLDPPAAPLTRSLPVKAQPASLDRASLDPCIGAPFYPGIEITFISEDPKLWAEPGRLQWRTLEPGDVTRHMALPWQADFSECNHRWWPAARPDDIVTQEQYDQVVKYYDPAADGPLQGALAARVEWARGIPQDSPGLDNGMVAHWADFGFIVPRTVNGQTVYVEEDRDKYAGTSLRDAFYFLMNISSYSDFLPHARKMVDRFLAQAALNARDPSTATSQNMYNWTYFKYTPEAFDARMENIYDQYVLSNSQAAGGSGGFLAGSTYEQRKYNILQMAPFNQLDGTWIRGAAPPGTVDEVRNLLFHIYMDELGDAVDAHNHSNVYTDLLRSLNIYLPDISSAEYANDPRFLDSAFVEPVFLLAISTFTEEYIPEILGMTLYLEWSSVGLAGIVAEMESFGMDPSYYRLHVGIDNASAGHGALAKQAIQLYLDNVRKQGGDAAMQAAFERIWTGYVAFGTLGTLGQDIQSHFASKPSLRDQMVALIESKAQYARQNHGTKKLGSNFLNDWFDDPLGLLDELVASGFIVPGKPDRSPIFQLMSFTGPMFHVFTPQEQLLWHDYIVSLAPAPPLPAFDLEKAMLYVVDTLRQRQSGTQGHQARLTGLDPRKNEMVNMPIGWWFSEQFSSSQEENDYVFLAALRDPVNGWIVPGNDAASPLLTQLLSGNGAMAQDFRQAVPERVAGGSANPGPYTMKQVLAMWVNAGCPIRGAVHQAATAKAPAAVVAAATATATTAKEPPASKGPSAPRRPLRIYGMGVPH